MFLARRNLRTLVLEKRPDMRKEAISAGRSINLAISTRGIRALKDVGLDDDILAQAVPMRGRMIHPISGDLSFQPYGKDDSEFLNSISRGDLNKSLMTFAEETGLVEFQFNQRVDGMDFNQSKLSVHDFNGGIDYELVAPVVLGTDGSASAIRQDMEKLPDFRNEGWLLEYGYKELVILPLKAGAFKMEKNALHIWPRKTYMLIALPNFEGSYTCTLFLPYKGEPSFEFLSTPELARRFFEEQFPDALPLIHKFEETWATNPVGEMWTVKSHPWYVGGRALIMGDAAHGIVPFFGQGMNCGFEDCTVFSQCLDEMTKVQHSGDVLSVPWEELFGRFLALRKENTDAIADMAVENFVEMRDKVGDPRFLLEKSVEKILQREFPGQYISRYSLVTFSSVPYKLALDVGVIEQEMLTELCRDIKNAADVDLTLAKTLIDSRLAHLLKPYRQELTGAPR
jgi:kynurenine 3-monooxygenase